MDLSRNKTLVADYNSQNISLGSEFNIVNRPWLNLALRGGLIKNLASDYSPLTYTAGLGLNLLHFVFELGGAISSDWVMMGDNLSLPSRAMLSMALSLNF